MSRYAQVIVDLSAEALDRVFTYIVPEGMDVQPGHLVAAPFGPRTVEGFVVALSDACDLPPEKLKPLLRLVRQEPVIQPDLMALAEWLHVRCLCNLVDALRLMLPAQMRGGRVREKTRRMARLTLSGEALEAFVARNGRAPKQLALIERLRGGEVAAAELDAGALSALVKKGAVEVSLSECRRTPNTLADDARTLDPEPTPEQRAAEERLDAALESGGGRFLLHGVTGSGKTEVYIRLIRKALEAGRTAIVLVPEIALTPQMVRWLHGRFGGDAAVLHSALSDGERFDEWRRIRSGEARVVIGARSAVFAPLSNIGVIVVDEEHEHTYQSEKRPRYDAREVAWKRAQQHKAVLVLGSATPSISTYMRAMPGVRPENRLELIELRHRVKGRPLPQVDVVDMRGEFDRGNRSIFSARLVGALKDCLDAGNQAMLFINRRGYSTFVSCRSCGFVVRCDQCDVSMTYHQSENALRCHYCGKTLPPPKLCPQCGSRYVKYFGAGTQMIAKGLDFPKVALVGVVAADVTLNLPDFRSVERTFQLITQVAGRAGRADVPGRVVVQTYEPEHYGIRLAAAQDYRAFYTRESAYRRSALYPPYSVIARIVYTGKDEAAVKAAALADEGRMEIFLDESGIRRDALQLAAAEAPIRQIRGEYRWQLLLKLYFKGDLDAAERRMQALAEATPEGVRAELEVNPNNLF